MAVTANDVKTLREMSQAGMLDCKKALDETAGDLQKALNLLRERGIAKASKRAGRSTSEGLVVSATAPDGKAGALVELTCETDFVARNPDFKALAARIAASVLAGRADGAEAANALSLDGATVAETVAKLVGTIGENMVLANAACLSAPENGAIASYIHFSGKIGVMLAFKFSTPAMATNGEIAELMNDLCLHAAAAGPRYLSEKDVDAATIANEREVARNKAINEGKPEKIVDKIVESSVQKFFEEFCLLNQPFVKDPKLTIAKVLAQKGKAAGGTIEIAAMRRFVIGEASKPADGAAS